MLTLLASLLLIAGYALVGLGVLFAAWLLVGIARRCLDGLSVSVAAQDSARAFGVCVDRVLGGEW